jgi:putative salt-induced outer membrane protein
MASRTPLVASCVIALLLAAPATAQEEDEAADPLEGKVKLGYLATSGNTDTSSLNTGFEATYTAGRWEHKALATAINASEDGTTTAEAYELGWKSGWDLTERDYLFGQLDWRKDRFGPFDTQFSQTVGYGRRLIDTGVHLLKGEVGAGARQSEDQLGVTQDETIFTGGLNYTWKLSETAEFSQLLRAEVGQDNTFSESITAITTRLIGGFNLVASYTIRNNSEAPAGTDKTDTRTALALEYGF